MSFLSVLSVVALCVTISQCQSVAYYQQLVPLPAGLQNQGGYTYLRSSTMTELFGAPCSLSANCQGVSNPSLKNQIETRAIGKFRFTGMKKALDALARALNRVQAEKPALYEALGSSGMLCCRAIRGGNSFSNHAWGAALDFNVGGVLDPRADGKTQRALLELYPYMHDAGFFWAAGYSAKYEDAMHFEIADQVVRNWGQETSWGTCTTTTGISGECQDTTTCTGTTESNRCPGPANIRCCYNAVPPPPKEYRCVTASRLYIRSGPCTSYGDVGSGVTGAPFEIVPGVAPTTACGYTWVKIRYQGVVGWAANQFLEQCVGAVSVDEDLGTVVNTTDLPSPGHDAFDPDYVALTSPAGFLSASVVAIILALVAAIL